MRLIKTIYLCNLLFVVLFCGLIPNLNAQYTHTLSESVDAKAEVNILHRRGTLKVLPATDGKIAYKAFISVDAADEATAKQVFEAYSVSVNTSGDAVSIQSGSNIKNVQVINGRGSISTKDGTTIKNVKNLKVALEVYVPKLRLLNVNNKYDDIQIADHITNNLVLGIHSGTLEVGTITGQLELTAKYSEGRVGDFSNGKLELFDSKINLGKGGTIALNSKYSKFEVEGADELQGEIFDSKINFGPIKGMVRLNDKYSDLKFQSMGDALLDIYDSDMQIGTAGDLHVKSKYTEWAIESAGTVDFEISHDDKITIAQCKSLQALSKYTEFTIGSLQEKLRLESHDDKINVNQLGDQFKTMDITAKYTELKCLIPGSIPYRLEAQTKYGKLQYNENSMEVMKHIENGSQLSLQGRTKGATDQSLMVKLNGHDCKFYLN